MCASRHTHAVVPSWQLCAAAGLGGRPHRILRRARVLCMDSPYVDVHNCSMHTAWQGHTRRSCTWCRLSRSPYKNSESWRHPPQEDTIATVAHGPAASMARFTTHRPAAAAASSRPSTPQPHSTSEEDSSACAADRSRRRRVVKPASVAITADEAPMAFTMPETSSSRSRGSTRNASTSTATPSAPRGASCRTTSSSPTSRPSRGSVVASAAQNGVCASTRCIPLSPPPICSAASSTLHPASQASFANHEIVPLMSRP